MRFDLGDRVRQFFPHLGYRTGRVVKADEETGVIVFEDDSDGTRWPVERNATNLTRNPPCHCDD
jgi:hypothetical protein